MNDNFYRFREEGRARGARKRDRRWLRGFGLTRSIFILIVSIPAELTLVGCASPPAVIPVVENHASAKATDGGMDEVMRDFNKQVDDIRAESNAKMAAARAAQVARFKAHPDQLKDPKRCDPGRFGKDWAEQWRTMIACEDVSGITAKRARATAPPGQRELDETNAQDKAEWDKLWSEMRVPYSPCARSVSACDSGLLTEEILRDEEWKRELQDLRNEFQSDDQQRRIDAEEKAIEEDEEVLRNVRPRD